MTGEPEANVRGSGPVEGDGGNREVPPADLGYRDIEEGDVPEAGPETVTDEPAELDQLAEATRQRDEYLDALQRLKAEFDNYRKRVARDQGDLIARASERLVKQLLPVLDDLERTLEAAAAHEEAKLEDGVRIVHRSLADTLAREGLVEIETEGLFDPHSQEALLVQPSEEDEGNVIQVLQKGYRLGGQVLRPARVVVSGGPGAESDPGGDAEGDA